MPRGDMLWNRLESARLPELHKLGEIVKLSEPKAKARDALVEELSKEIRAAAGHFLPNIFRGEHEFPYKQMLIDVADKLAPGWTFLAWTGYKLDDARTESDVEEAAWGFFEKIVQRKLSGTPQAAKEDLRKETESELRKMGYSEMLISQVGAGLLGGTAGAFFGPALAYHMALNTASGFAWAKLWWIGKVSMVTMLGWSSAIMAVVYVPALAWWLGNTAYRKTIPATLYLIQIRKLREIEKKLG